MSSWAAHAIKRLEDGKRATIRPRGFSMRPLIESGAEVELAPIKDGIQVDDIVLVRVAGRVYLHKVSALDRGRVQISNNQGRVNGWVSSNAVMGRAIRIDNDPKPKTNGKRNFRKREPRQQNT